jgi:hypothetical protein
MFRDLGEPTPNRSARYCKDFTALLELNAPAPPHERRRG